MVPGDTPTTGGPLGAMMPKTDREESILHQSSGRQNSYAVLAPLMSTVKPKIIERE